MAAFPWYPTALPTRRWETCSPCVAALPNMTVVVRCDVVETRKATDFLLLKHQGPKYIRFARDATPW